MKRRDFCTELGRGRRLTSNFISKKEKGKPWKGLICLWIWTSVGLL
jgi:hypothetical protein